jgi:hypothetical protein
LIGRRMVFNKTGMKKPRILIITMVSFKNCFISVCNNLPKILQVMKLLISAMMMGWKTLKFLFLQQWILMEQWTRKSIQIWLKVNFYLKLLLFNTNFYLFEFKRTNIKGNEWATEIARNLNDQNNSNFLLFPKLRKDNTLTPQKFLCFCSYVYWWWM